MYISTLPDILIPSKSGYFGFAFIPATLCARQCKRPAAEAVDEQSPPQPVRHAARLRAQARHAHSGPACRQVSWRESARV